MRKLMILFLIVFSISHLNAQSLSEQAQKAYQEGDFETAIGLYEKEIKTLEAEGKVSAQLYYNLGNAYFRANEMPKAILNYERAQLYDPGDRDIKHNIKYANTKIEDRILNADTFFLSIWFESVQNFMSSAAWAKTAIVCFILLLISLVLFFFGKRLILKKAGFYLGIIFLVFTIFSNIFAFTQKSKLKNHNTAIIMVGSAPVVSSPTSNSNELFVLHEGTKVDIRKKDGDWFEIEIADGSVGWIQKSKLEVI